MSFRPRTFAELAATWPPDLDHISASSVTMFARCPEQFRHRYCLGKINPPSAAAIHGKANGHAIGHNLEQKIETHEDLPLADVVEMFSSSWDGELEMYGGATEIEFGKERLTGDDARKEAAKIKDQGVTLVGIYAATVCPKIQPIGVEVRFHVETPELPVLIDGYLDVETEEQIIERKTGQRTLSQPNPDWVLQGRIYQAVKRKPLVWHQSVRKKEPVIVTEEVAVGMKLDDDPQRTRVTMGLLQQTVRTIGFYYSVYGPDQPWPGALTHPWACGYCAYKPDCPWWA